MFGLGIQELIVIALIILIFIVFGTKKLPGIGKGLGGTVREFKNIEKELTGTATGRKTSSKSKVNGKTTSSKSRTRQNQSAPSVESMVTKQILGQIPGVRKVMNIKDKVDKVRDIIK